MYNQINKPPFLFIFRKFPGHIILNTIEINFIFLLYIRIYELLVKTLLSTLEKLNSKILENMFRENTVDLI